MRFEKLLLLVCLFLSPLFVAAEEKVGHKFTAKGRIVFAPTSQAAFDHSGTLVSQTVLADGSMMAEHNGSLGNVTVARLGSDGKLETFCTSDEDAAKSWMAGEDMVTNPASLNPSRSDR